MFCKAIGHDWGLRFVPLNHQNWGSFSNYDQQKTQKADNIFYSR